MAVIMAGYITALEQEPQLLQQQQQQQQNQDAPAEDDLTAPSSSSSFVSSSSSSSPGTNTFSLSSQSRGAPANRSIRSWILSLLSVCLPQKVPNFAHFLLGFPVDSGSNSSAISEFDLDYNPVTTCLSVLVSLLSPPPSTTTTTATATTVGPSGRGGSSSSSSVVVGAGGSGLSVQQPRVAEQAYHFIYQLITDRLTSYPVLNYLRMKPRGNV